MSARIKFYNSAFCIKEIITHPNEQTYFYDSKRKKKQTCTTRICDFQEDKNDTESIKKKK